MANQKPKWKRFKEGPQIQGHYFLTPHKIVVRAEERTLSDTGEIRKVVVLGIPEIAVECLWDSPGGAKACALRAVQESLLWIQEELSSLE